MVKLVTVKIRIYPSCCTSAFCSESECPTDCCDLPKLLEFRAWVKRTGAVVLDETWTPNTYTAQKEVQQ